MRDTKGGVLCFVGLILIAGCLVFVSCTNDEPEDGPDTGTVEFYANGEDFVRDGFTSMDDWDLEFDHLYINLATPTAYQGIEEAEEEKKALGGVESKHGGHPHGTIPEDAPHASLLGMYFVDLAQGDDATLVGMAEDAELGNYNYVNFDVVAFDPDDEDQVIMPDLNQADLDDYEGKSIIMIGTADNGRVTIEFTIKLDEQMEYSTCGPWAEGIVEADGTGTAEMTFHFDHVFGDANELPGEGANEIALGFDPLADLWSGVGPLVLNQLLMGTEMSGIDFLTFIDALRTIGHSGEGHCAYEKIW